MKTKLCIVLIFLINFSICNFTYSQSAYSYTKTIELTFSGSNDSLLFDFDSIPSAILSDVKISIEHSGVHNAISEQVVCGTEQVICGTQQVVCGQTSYVCGSVQVICGTEQVFCGTEQVVCGTEPVFCGTEQVVCGTEEYICGTYCCGTDEDGNCISYCDEYCSQDTYCDQDVFCDQDVYCTQDIYCEQNVYCNQDIYCTEDVYCTENVYCEQNVYCNESIVGNYHIHPLNKVFDYNTITSSNVCSQILSAPVTLTVPMQQFSDSLLGSSHFIIIANPSIAGLDASCQFNKIRITIMANLIPTGVEFVITEPLAISVYPNPASNSINVTGIKGKASLNMYDGIGRLVMTKTAKEDTTLDTSQLEQGIYTLVTESEDARTSNKVLISR